MQAAQPNPVDSLLFRQVMSSFATGVTVVTTVVDGQVHGMTANAFTSVSLSPPLVLAEDQKPISQHFAGWPQEGLKIGFFWREGMAMIENALAHLVCELWAQHPAGDHSLYLGKVSYLHYQGNRAPLLFYGGHYRSLDSHIRDPEFWWW